MQYALGWAIRNTHEAQMHPRTSFITLTYSPEHLPKNKSLNVRHWQLFAKRLRKALGPFRYYHCGEYGEQFLRPHYHALIFGHDFHQDRILNGVNKFGNKKYRSAELDRLWGKGICDIGSVTFQSASYVSRYIMKKAKGCEEYKDDYYDFIDTETGEVFPVEPEYTTMSLKPGIGETFLEKYLEDIYSHDFVVINERKFKPPKFYDNYLQCRDPERLQRLKAKRLKKSLEHADDNTPERLDVKEAILKIRDDRFQREIDTSETDTQKVKSQIIHGPMKSQSHYETNRNAYKDQKVKELLKPY